jgi:branched-chain amino acid transport system permease protein
MRKLARACVAGLLLALTSTFSIGSAQAAEEVSVISGVMQGPMGEPMAGVELSATGPDGFTADLTSAVDGSWSFEISIAGEYFVTIDPTTLPSGVALTEQDKLTKQVIVFMIGSPTPTVKFLTGDGPERDPMWQTAMQLTLDGIILGITISLAAVGLSLIFGTTGLTNFAHGELITLGGLTTFFFNKMGLHGVLAAIIS